MLDARELHMLARDPDEPVPDAFADAHARLGELRAATSEAVEQRNELIREARAVGVSYPALARWTSLHQATIYAIVNGSDDY